MAKVSLCVLPSRANQDGSMNIRVKITNINTTAYIATRFRIENMGQWKGERVVKHPEAEIMNRKLRKVIMEYEDRLDAIESGGMSAAEIKVCLEAEKDRSDLLKAHAEKYIARLEKEKRESYALYPEISA